MKKSSKPIIEHIPLFLNYCKEIDLSDNTQKNYQRYLNKFIFWLKKNNKENLSPHELSPDDIWQYRLFLSRNIGPKTGKSLKKSTQNYYLIALRALLSYFSVKDILSMPTNKIKLLGGIKVEKPVNFITPDQINELLKAPDTNTLIGLRDRAILEILVSTGLKVNQLIKLNRNQLENINKEVLPLLEEYLGTRKDKNNALFINYKAKRSSIGARLTIRSIERVVNYYGRKINLPFFITPEILRWARANALLNKEIKIYKPQGHKVFVIKNYRDKEAIKIPSLNQKYGKDISPTWHVVENIINKEIDWLKDNIPTMPETYKENPPFLKYDDSILRKIAILIVSREVKAAEFKNEDENKDLWDGLIKKENLNKINRHGQEWHKKMMDVIYEYFKLRNCKIILEPALNYGRGDLGIYSIPNNPFYIEVGTISLFKLWYNLSTMKNVTYLIVPSENKVIEFNT